MTRLIAFFVLLLLLGACAPAPPPTPTGPWAPINGGWTPTQAEMEALPK